MRALVSIVLALAIVLGIYYFYLKRAQGPGNSGTPAQAITLTGVQADLLAIAKAERVYYAEHSAYATLSELTASGALTMARSGRDGYAYSIETTAEGFTVTARYTGPPGEMRYPTLTVDQTMEIRHSD